MRMKCNENENYSIKHSQVFMPEFVIPQNSKPLLKAAHQTLNSPYNSNLKNIAASLHEF